MIIKLLQNRRNKVVIGLTCRAILVWNLTYDFKSSSNAYDIRPKLHST